MPQTSETLLKAYALIAARGELFAAVEDLHRHFSGESLTAVPADQLPGIVLRWLNCYADLELWHEAFAERPSASDVELALDFAAELDELGIEPIGEQACHACDYRSRCR